MASWREPALLAAALAVGACSVTAADSLPAERAENAAPHTGDRSGVVAPAPDGQVALATLEAAVRADAARAWNRPDAVALALRVEEATWSDGSLGCPLPGRAYTQALVPGWRLVVRDDGREAVYHASRRGQWLFCPAGRARPPLPGPAIR
jgi:hypothetical protein